MAARLAVSLAFLVLASLGAACDSPPQIVEISPGRGAQEVRTNAPVRIRFDRPVNKASVGASFNLLPAASGELAWPDASTLVFNHTTLRPDAEYEVILAPGYRDASGKSNPLRHSWKFHTEPPPALRSTTPAAGDQGVDPAAFLTLVFSREMDPASVGSALSFAPAADFSVRSDPGDAKRLVVAPQTLLDPSSHYELAIAPGAKDVDGNSLPAAQLSFTTGPVRSLRRLITFIAGQTSSDPGTGVWMVDSGGFPRQLVAGPVDGFLWTADGLGLLVRRPGGSWEQVTLGSNQVRLPFSASWAAYLGEAAGYVYLDGRRLRRLLPDASTVDIATGVDEAAVSPDLARVAFSVHDLGGAEIRGYDVALRAQYRIQREALPISAIAWSPDGRRLAYLEESAGAGTLQLRVKTLGGAGTAATLATGSISRPVWSAGSNDLIFSAEIEVAGGASTRLFRLNTALPPPRLTSAGALPAAGPGDSWNPRPSPDGHQIAFLAGSPASAQVWLMNADGTGLARLTRFDAEAFPFSCREVHWGEP